MNRILLGLFLLFISTAAISQETKTKKKKVRLKKQLSAAAKEQINQLSEGVLLVRLKTKSNAINALRKAGKNAEADKIEKKQAELNLNIINAFKAKLNFCPTLFFYSDYSAHIKENQLDKVIFLNDNLQADSTIKLKNKKILVAEFGKVVQDTGTYFSHYSYEPDGNFGLKKVSNYYNGSSFGFDAIVISSKKLTQLRRPFPYFKRTRNPMPGKKAIYRKVKRMNKKLIKFYIRANT